MPAESVCELLTQIQPFDVLYLQPSVFEAKALFAVTVPTTVEVPDNL